MRMALLVGILASGLLVGRVAAQDANPLGSEIQEYYRLLEITGHATGPLFFHSSSSLRSATDGTQLWTSDHTREQGTDGSSGIRLRLLNPELRSTYNGGYPSSRNDGALWAGRGVSTLLTAGARVRWRFLTVTAAPSFTYSQNRAFSLAPPAYTADRSAYAYPWTPHIDLPQRFGDGPLSRMDWGQSGVRLDFGPVTAGVTSENMWWGPAVENPLLMSNTAAGFPHADFGTHRVHTPLGLVEVRAVWGSLTESAFFDTVSTNNKRFFTGVTAALQPKWIPGLTLGFARLYYQFSDSTKFSDLFVFFQPFTKDALATPSDPEGGDDRDQMLSVSVRWVLPRSGFEVYGEYAKNDHHRNWRDFALEPEHARAWLLGFQQAIPSGQALIRLRGEWADLGRAPTFQVRAEPTFYQHHIVQQGYTERGQLLGAGIGGGSDAQVLAVDRYDRGGRFGVFARRIRFDDDAYYRLFAPPELREGHEVELTAGVSAFRFFGGLAVGGEISFSRMLNRYYIVGNDVTNVAASISLKWSWASRRR